MRCVPGLGAAHHCVLAVRVVNQEVLRAQNMSFEQIQNGIAHLETLLVDE